jgi:hypothetical protein
MEASEREATVPSPTSPIAPDAKHSDGGSDDHAVQPESASSPAALATAATGASPVVVKTEPNGAGEESEASDMEASRTGAARGTRTSSRYTNWATRAQQIKIEEAEALAQAEAEETKRFAARMQKEANRSARAQTVATANTNTMAGVHRNHRDLMLAPGAMEMLNMLAGVGGGSAGAAGGGAAVAAAAAAAAAAGGSARTPWLGGLAGGEVGVGSAYMRAYDGLVASQNGSISGAAGGGGGGVKREWLGLEGDDDAEEEDVKPKKRVRSRKKGAGAGAKRKKGAAAKRGSATEDSGARKCGRCGKPNHTSRTCVSKTHADGRNLKTINCRRCERPTHAHLGPCDFKTDIHGRKVTAPPIKAVCKAKKTGKGRGRKQAAVDEGEF